MRVIARTAGLILVTLFVCVTGYVLPIAAAPPNVDKAVVYIQCKAPDRAETWVGSGVIVDQNGTVLTASHVAQEGTECAGSIGSAEPGNLNKLIRTPSVTSVDAALLRFAAPGPYHYVGFCDLEDWMIRRPIIVAGFPAGTETGALSFRKGVLSTTLTDSRGVFETDGQSTSGMSGGPVFSSNLAGFVGIVLSKKFDGRGTISHHEILSASQVARQLGLDRATKPCFHERPFVDLPGIEVRSGATVETDVSADEAVCFISGIRGTTNGDSDFVRVVAGLENWVVEGFNGGGQPLSVDVRCLWYE